METIESKIDAYLEDLKQHNLLRQLTAYDADSEYLDFSSNDYLALSHNVESINAGICAVQRYGTGSTGSRLLSGNKRIFDEFERTIAIDKHMESALIFNSGYIANLSTIAALQALRYQLVFDKLNHASMYQGAYFQHSDLKHLLRFNHLDYEHLEEILRKNNSTEKVIVSETVFGMDGDIADLHQLIHLAEKYNALLYLDEAHATGLYGNHGYGISTNFDFDVSRTIIMGTFSKALASSGAYVACSQKFKEFLLQISKGFIYSTALSPFCIGVAQHNWKMLPQLNKERKELIAKASYLRKKLVTNGYKCIGNKTNIVPIVYDDTAKMLDDYRKFRDQKIITSAVRRPTSPTPRIRIAVNVSHSYSDMDRLAETLIN